MGTDTVTLSLPRKPGYLPLLHLVLGGIALRKELSFDALDDVQLAVDNLMALDLVADGDLEIKVSLTDEGLLIRLGAFEDAALKESLLGDRSGQLEERRLDAVVLLRSLVDEYRVVGASEGGFAIELLKKTG